MKTIRLREGKERSLLKRHPWIFESAIARGGGDVGETVRVESHAGQFLAWAAFSPASKIRARVWSFEENRRIDAAFFRAQCAAAIQARQRFDIRSDAMRLVHGESDGLPGLVVDRYGDTLVAQFLSAGAERWKPVLADALMAETGLQRLYERSDTSSRALEGLAEASGWLRGDGPTGLVLQEHEWQLGLDIAQGHKTGFYLDQRDSRHRNSPTRCPPARVRSAVLNCYCYTGGFTVAALSRQARRTSPRSTPRRRRHGAGTAANIERSTASTRRARAEFRGRRCQRQRCGRFQAEEGRTFDAIVLDPPKLAPTAAHAERASPAPTRTSTGWPSSCCEPGGVLFTYSCSGGISADLFHKIVASAGADAGVDGYITRASWAARQTTP